MLQQKLQQKQQLKLSPQQIQTIKLLEIPMLELEERIRQEVEENPALEISDNPMESGENDNREKEESGENDPDNDYEGSNYDEDNYLNDYKSEDDAPDYAIEAQSRQEAQREGVSYLNGETLQEHLTNQLSLRSVKPELKEVTEYVWMTTPSRQERSSTKSSLKRRLTSSNHSIQQAWRQPHWRSAYCFNWRGKIQHRRLKRRN